MKRPPITLGEWGKRDFGPIATMTGNVRYIAQICPHGKGNTEDDEDKANAALIAAAPQMAEALEKLYSAVSAMVGMGEESPSIFLSDAGKAAFDANKEAKQALIAAGYEFP